MLLLAQLPDPGASESIGWLLAALAALCVAINQVLKITDRFKEKPSPADTYATKAEHAELKNRVDGLAAKIDKAFVDLDEKRSRSIAGLHHDLDAKVGILRRELKEDTEALHNRCTEILTKVSELWGSLKR